MPKLAPNKCFFCTTTQQKCVIKVLALIFLPKLRYNNDKDKGKPVYFICLLLTELSR